MTSVAVREPARRWQRSLPIASVVASALLVLGPALRPGYVLRYDMVFAPDMPLGRELVGLGSQLPRAVPSDLVVSVLSHVLPGDLVQDLVLLVLVIAGGAGAQRLCASSVAARVTAGLAYVWTPYVAERLLLGQWAVLIGWAVLPWLVVVSRTGRLRHWVAVAGLAALGGAPALLLCVPAGLAVAGRVAGRGWWRAVAVRVGATVLLSLPWLLPTVLRPSRVGADRLGATVFAPRADTPLGRVVSLLTGGGIWNADAVPPGRDAVVPALLAVGLLVLGVVGLLRRRRDPATVPLAVVAVVFTSVAVVAAWPAGARAVAALPGGAALRDAQRLVLPLVLALAVGVGTAVGDVVCDVLPRTGGRALSRLVFLLVLLPVAALPALAWGVSGRLVPVAYPADVLRARAVIDHDRRPGGVLVLPAEAYRRYAWNGHRTSLDVLPRLLDRPTVVVQDLPVAVGGRVVVVRGEDRLAARLAAAARAGALARTAARAGVRFVVVDAPATTAPAGLRLLRRYPELAVFEVPGVDAHRARAVAGPYAAPTLPVVLGDVAALLAFGAAVAASAAGTRGRRTRRPRARLLGSRSGDGEHRETD